MEKEPQESNPFGFLAPSDHAILFCPICSKNLIFHSNIIARFYLTKFIVHIYFYWCDLELIVLFYCFAMLQSNIWYIKGPLYEKDGLCLQLRYICLLLTYFTWAKYMLCLVHKIDRWIWKTLFFWVGHFGFFFASFLFKLVTIYGIPRIFQNFDDYPYFQQKSRGV